MSSRASALFEERLPAPAIMSASTDLVDSPSSTATVTGSSRPSTRASSILKERARPFRLRLPATTWMCRTSSCSSSTTTMTTARGVSTHAVEPRTLATAPRERSLLGWRTPMTRQSSSSASRLSGAIASRTSASEFELRSPM